MRSSQGVFTSDPILDAERGCLSTEPFSKEHQITAA